MLTITDISLFLTLVFYLYQTNTLKDAATCKEKVKLTVNLLIMASVI